MNKKTLYLLCFLLSGCLAVMLCYIEYRIIIQMSHFEEPVYYLPNYNIELTGINATLAHMLNVILAFFSIITTLICYTKYRK